MSKFIIYYIQDRYNYKPKTKEMNKSWRTTSAGIIAIVTGLVGLYFAFKAGPVDQATLIASITGIVGGIGLLLAKDSNVTGGSVDNGERPN